MDLGLGSLGSLISNNPLAAVGNAVKGVVSEIVPGPLGKVAGDAAAGVCDYETGNIPGLVQDGMSAMNDLPQAEQQLQQAQAGASSAAGPSSPSSSSEPSPPPSKSAASTPPPGAPPAASTAPAAGPAVETKSGVGHFDGASTTASGSSTPSTPPPSAPPTSPLPNLANLFGGGGGGGLDGIMKLLDPLGLFSGLLGGAKAPAAAAPAPAPAPAPTAPSTDSAAATSADDPKPDATPSHKPSASTGSSSKAPTKIEVSVTTGSGEVSVDVSTGSTPASSGSTSQASRPEVIHDKLDLQTRTLSTPASRISGSQPSPTPPSHSAPTSNSQFHGSPPGTTRVDTVVQKATTGTLGSSGWRGTPPASSDSKVKGSGSSSVDPSTLSKDDFMNLGNDAFMQAVMAGKIPKEISDSPAAMQALQARMNNISEMNQLMTSMINAVHQMEMSVIQNVRV